MHCVRNLYGNLLHLRISSRRPAAPLVRQDGITATIYMEIIMITSRKSTRRKAQPSRSSHAADDTVLPVILPAAAATYLHDQQVRAAELAGVLRLIDQDSERPATALAYRVAKGLAEALSLVNVERAMRLAALIATTPKGAVS